MNPETLMTVAIVVFVLMLVGLALTVFEFRHGAPQEQIEDEEKIIDSPHRHVNTELTK
jgi:hypothetical protein